MISCIESIWKACLCSLHVYKYLHEHGESLVVIGNICHIFILLRYYILLLNTLHIFILLRYYISLLNTLHVYILNNRVRLIVNNKYLIEDLTIAEDIYGGQLR